MSESQEEEHLLQARLVAALHQQHATAQQMQHYGFPPEQEGTLFSSGAMQQQHHLQQLQHYGGGDEGDVHGNGGFAAARGPPNVNKRRRYQETEGDGHGGEGMGSDDAASGDDVDEHGVKIRQVRVVILPSNALTSRQDMCL
eukprot:TRINITY_DN25051_c0_g1_i1.p3 TRINITY_DN25051_c0_g1~~TRINITY_DN25051_c0_g1_i1.p3  ORF type:complete len:142 (-),score=40.02 TRINITY_DN25051_c0_g1_i1:886-1311(-)